MFVTEKQLLALLQIAMDSGSIIDTAGSPFHFAVETRRKLVEDVLNQQTGTLTARKEPHD